VPIVVGVVAGMRWRDECVPNSWLCGLDVAAWFGLAWIAGIAVATCLAAMGRHRHAGVAVLGIGFGFVAMRLVFSLDAYRPLWTDALILAAWTCLPPTVADIAGRIVRGRWRRGPTESSASSK
jgi:hypothetical protein